MRVHLVDKFKKMEIERKYQALVEMIYTAGLLKVGPYWNSAVTDGHNFGTHLSNLGAFIAA